MDLAIWIPLPVILIFGFMGFRDGVVKRLLEVMGILVTLVLAGRFATAMLPWMQDRTGFPEGGALLITWAGLFLVGFLLSKLLAAFVSKLVRLTILGWVDRWGGAVIGVVIGTLFCSVILVAVNQVAGDRTVQKAYEKSPGGDFLFHTAPNFYRQVQSLSGGNANEVWNRVLEKARDQADQAAENTREQVEEKLEDVKDSAGS
ncbi:MAG: CvpA family protein [Gemmatimonadales bacterium]|nr:CvpA family protein [Gemmatimonadales bacterium]